MWEDTNFGAEAVIFWALTDKPGDGIQGNDETEKADKTLGPWRHH